MYRNTMEIYDYFGVNIFAGGVILNGEGTATDTQEILANKGDVNFKSLMIRIIWYSFLREKILFIFYFKVYICFLKFNNA